MKVKRDNSGEHEGRKNDMQEREIQKRRDKEGRLRKDNEGRYRKDTIKMQKRYETKKEE